MDRLSKFNKETKNNFTMSVICSSVAFVLLLQDFFINETPLYIRLLFLILPVILLLISLFLLTRNDRIDVIIKYFDLNENEAFLFSWITSLIEEGLFYEEVEFDSWMGDFSNRYTDREMYVMKLHFNIIQ